MAGTRSFIKSRFISAGDFFKLLMWLYVAKSFVLAIILTIHTKLTNQESREASVNKSLESSIYALATNLGCISCHLGKYKSLGYSLYVFITFSHLILGYYCRHKLRLSESRGLVPFLRNHKRESKDLSLRHAARIRILLESNLHYRKSCSYSALGGTNLNWPSDMREIFKKSNVSSKDQRWLAFNLCEPGVAKNDLEMQAIFLDFLAKNQSSIWPDNRTRVWYRVASGLWFVFCFFIMFGIWAIGNLTAYLYGELSLKMTSDEKDAAFFMDLAGQQMFTAFIMEWYYLPVSIMTLGYFDQYKWLVSIRLRMRAFNEKLANLHEFCDSQFAIHEAPDSLSLIESGSVSASLKIILNKRYQFLDKFRQKLDCEALELYVILRSFSEEINSYFAQAEYSISTAYSTVIAVTVAMIALAPRIPRDYLGVYALILASTILMLDMAIYPTALLTNQCIKTVQLCWPLIARCESFRMAERKANSWRVKNINPLKLPRHIITRHTLDLWRKFICDHDALCHTFSCKFLGLFKINFRTMLQLNFALASVIVMLLSVGDSK